MPLNYVFFNNSSKQTNAVDSSIYMTTSALIGIFMPPLGAAVILHWGYSWLFSLASILCIIPLFLIYRELPNSNLNFNLKESLLSFNKLKTLTLLEGSLHYFTGVIIPVYSLIFFSKASEIGYFYSYLGIISFIIALYFSHRSDRSGKRITYLFIVCILMAVVIVSMGLVKSMLGGIIVAGAFSVVNYVSFPFRLAVSMDDKTMDLGFWVVRELILNVGRVITLTLALVLFYYELYLFVFLIYALVAITYPFITKFKLKNLI